jgi:hypothetical protein
MFKLIKFIIWLAGIAVITYFVLDYFGYEINRDYFSDSKKKCEENLKECSNNILHKGIDKAQCEYNCIDPKLVIKKQ